MSAAAVCAICGRCGRRFVLRFVKEAGRRQTPRPQVLVVVNVENLRDPMRASSEMQNCILKVRAARRDSKPGASEELRERPGVLPDVFLDGAIAKLEGRWFS